METVIAQNLTIELNTQGRNTIPYVDSGNIITIHGKNGVGKSMAATLLEIASGNYIFQNESRFQKLANVIESCEIKFKTDNINLYKVILKPHLWRFDKNLNKINPLTIGDFYQGDQKNEKKINFDEFKKNIYIRTIRGNESLQQQVFFFKDIFVAKINQKIEKLEYKIGFLDKYQEWLKRNDTDKDIDKYTQFQEKYNDQLNKISNYENSIRNRENSLENLGNKLKSLEKLKFISINDMETIVKKKEIEEKRVEETKKEIQAKYIGLTNIKDKLEEIKNQFDSKTKEQLKKLKTFRKKKKALKEQLISQFKFDNNNIVNGKTEQNIIEIKNKIQHYQDSIKNHKEGIEKLNKENQNILEINKFIIQLRDVCSVACSRDFGENGLIQAKINGKFDITLSFEELYKIFNKNNLEFKQDEKLKEYISKVQAANERIQEGRKKLELLMDYNKIFDNISQILKEIKSKGSKIDNYLDADKLLDNLQVKKQDQLNIIEKLEKDILASNQTIEELNKIIEEIGNNPSKSSLLNDLNKLGIKIDKNKPLIEICEQYISNTENEIKQSQSELTKMRDDRELIVNKLENTKSELDTSANRLREVIKQYGYINLGEFVAYYKLHFQRFKNYFENTTKLLSRLKILKDDIVKVIEGGKPKNKTHVDMINYEFDQIFKNLYGRKEFFEYVFKDYTRIKQFDIKNKTIIFETNAGLEEIRDLEEFSSGEKTYAYCRSIISMTANLAKYNIVVLDESYALLDHEHSENLYQFQEKMVQQNKITKFINILPLKENLDNLINIVEKNLKSVGNKREDSRFFKSQLNLLKSFQNDVSLRGYYQEVHYPKENLKELKLNFGITQSFEKKITDDGQLNEELKFSFILDGSNIARSNQNIKKANIRDVARCKEKLQKFGVPENNIFIIFSAGIWHYINERDKPLYESLLSNRNVSQGPPGKDDDWFIIKFALDHNSYIITNDWYKEYRKKSSEIENFISSHSIRYNIIGNDINFEEGFDNKLKLIIAKN